MWAGPKSRNWDGAVKETVIGPKGLDPTHNPPLSEQETLE